MGEGSGPDPPEGGCPAQGVKTTRNQPYCMNGPGSENTRLIAIFALGVSVGICLALLYIELTNRFF